MSVKGLSVMPFDQPHVLVVRGPDDLGEHYYRVYARATDSQTGQIRKLTRLAVSRNPEGDADELLVRFPQGEGGGILWSGYSVVVAACPLSRGGTQVAQMDDGSGAQVIRAAVAPIWVGTGEISFSSWAGGVVAALLACAVSVLLLVYCAAKRARNIEPLEPEDGSGSSGGPAKGATGTDTRRLKTADIMRGMQLNLTGLHYRISLSKLQLILFSIAVFVVVAYVFGRTGQLSDLSTDILFLLGIAAGSGAIAAATDGHRQRLSWDNWIWLKENRILPQEANVPLRWFDLVSTSGDFDPARFQALIFTLLVVPAFIIMSFASLGTVTIPQGILAVLGLSQVTYLAGKLVAPPTIAEFDAELSKYRQRLSANEKITAEEAQSLMVGYKAAVEHEWPRSRRLVALDPSEAGEPRTPWLSHGGISGTPPTTRTADADAEPTDDVRGTPQPQPN